MEREFEILDCHYCDRQFGSDLSLKFHIKVRHTENFTKPDELQGGQPGMKVKRESEVNDTLGVQHRNASSSSNTNVPTYSHEGTTSVPVSMPERIGNETMDQDLEIPMETQNKPSAAHEVIGTKLKARVRGKSGINAKSSRIRKFICGFCTKPFLHTTALERHIRTHTGEKPYTCTERNCPFSSSQPQVIKTHVATIHVQRNPYPCTLCTASFMKSHNLKLHVASHNEMPASVKKLPQASPREKPQFQLPKKTEVSRSKPQMKMSSYNQQMRDPTKFQTKLTLSSEYLKSHLCVCPTCGFALPNKTIVSHRRFHDGIGTHRCVVCRVSYMSRDGIEQHKKSRLHLMRIGDGEPRRVIRTAQPRPKGVHLNQFKAGSSPEKYPTSMSKLTESKFWTEDSMTTGKQRNGISTNQLDPAFQRKSSSEDVEEVNGWVSEANSRITWSQDANQNLVGTQFCGRLKIRGIRYNRQVVQ